MATTTKPAKADEPALPALDSITSMSADELPATTKGPQLSADEITLAKAIIAAASDGKYAVGSESKDRTAATAAAARMRRLVTRYLGSNGTPKAERQTVSTRIVPKNGGKAWALTLVAPKGAETTPDAAAIEGNADTAANVAAGVTA